MKRTIWIFAVILSSASLAGCSTGPWKWTLPPVKITVTPDRTSSIVMTPQPTAVDDPAFALHALPVLPGATHVMSPSLEHFDLYMSLSYSAPDHGEQNETSVLTMLERTGWR